MPVNVTLEITSLTPASGPSDAASFNLVVTFSLSEITPTGSLTITANGSPVGGPIVVTGAVMSLAAAMNNPTAPGVYGIQVHYTGDTTYNPADSNTVNFTVTGDAPTATRQQAVIRPQCSSASGTALTRTQIENGELPDSVYQVTAMSIIAAGSAYDSYSVATLTGTVGGTATRQTLTLALDSNGGITGVTGFDSTTNWDAVPRLTLTRWKSGGTFDGY